MNDYHFKGYATKVNIKCSDGRTILKDAFKDNDGTSVPLVWQHMHNSPSNILGHAVLENRSDGVYAYCKFNDTPAGLNAKELVKHGDITALSIYANSLIQKGKDVIHGIIREVSLVLTGANPGAIIENVAVEHADGSIVTEDDEAVIYSGLEFEKAEILTPPDSEPLTNPVTVAHANTSKESLETLMHKLLEKKDANKDKNEKITKESLHDFLKKALSHADENSEATDKNDKTVEEIFQTMNDDQKEFVYTYIIHSIYGDQVFKDLGKLDEGAPTGDKKTLNDVFESMTEDQKNCVYTIAHMLDESEQDDEEDGTDDETNEENTKTTGEAAQSNITGGSKAMKKNVFDNSTDDKEVVQHTKEELKTIFEDAKRLGSMKEACLAHSITNIDVLFPDAKTVGAMPETVKRDTDWVPTIINGTKHVPFSRVKSYAADLTAEEARAKGYVKGNQKAEEVISVLKRVTNPTTIYKTQKLDRDDILDITDFDVVAFLKNEMRLMLDEELARAILTGDNRLISSADKISEDCIRPVYKDVAPFVTRYTLDAGLPVMDLIDSIVRARKDYQGSGNPILFATTDIITDMLLVKDTTGRRIYPTEAELASGLRVSGLVEVDVMEGISRLVNTDTLLLKAIMFNPRDYTVGSNAGGQITFFDDFDIDYNKMKYLIETRVSGCLTRPKAAIVFEQISV